MYVEEYTILYHVKYTVLYPCEYTVKYPAECTVMYPEEYTVLYLREYTVVYPSESCTMRRTLSCTMRSTQSCALLNTQFCTSRIIPSFTLQSTLSCVMMSTPSCTLVNTSSCTLVNTLSCILRITLSCITRSTPFCNNWSTPFCVPRYITSCTARKSTIGAACGDSTNKTLLRNSVLDRNLSPGIMVRAIDDSLLPQNSGSLPQNTDDTDPPTGDGARSAEEEQRQKELEDQRVQDPNPAAVAPPTVSVDDLKEIIAVATRDLADSILETNRKLNELARGIQQQTSSDMTPLIPRALAPNFDFTDAQSNRFTRMPPSSHQPNVRNAQQVHPQTSGTFIPGTSTLEQGGHLEDIYARLREIGSQVHQVTRGSDPKHFMTSFMTTIAKAHFSDEQRDIGCCQLFVEGLTGNALTWFSKLEANSIDNFTQLSTAFLKQYRVFIQPGASSSDFWSMTQEADKTLNTYLGRFKEILSKVTISDEAAVAVFRKGLLQGSQLRKDLAIREPKDLDDALNRASRYAFLEDKEAKLAAKHHPAKAKEKNRETHQEPRQHYDPNTAKRGTVFAATESEGRPPAPAKPSDSKSSYCHFHNFGGHSTEECKHLLNILLGKYKSGEVEAVYQPKEGRNKRRGGKQPQGDLEEDDLPPPENHQANREEEARVPEHELPGPPKRLRGQHPERAPNQPRGRISMIMGGLSDGEDYVRALKKRACQVCSVVAAPEKEQLSQDPITFTPEDAHGLQHPHNDALVVELVMEDFEVERVLVDTGSSVNQMFLQTLEKMGISERKIKPKVRPLTGYDGEAKMSIGEIKLQVRAGGITRRTKFVVIDATPIYNAILGSPWIYSMGVHRHVPWRGHNHVSMGLRSLTPCVIHRPIPCVYTFMYPVLYSTEYTVMYVEEYTILYHVKYTVLYPCEYTVKYPAECTVMYPEEYTVLYLREYTVVYPSESCTMRRTLSCTMRKSTIGAACGDSTNKTLLRNSVLDRNLSPGIMVRAIDDSLLPQNSGSLPQNTDDTDPPTGDGARSAEEEQRQKELEDQRVQDPNPAAVALPTVSVDDLKEIIAVATRDLADSILETNRKLNELARGIQQQTSSDMTPLIPRALAPNFDFTDAQSNRFTRMPPSSHQPNVRNAQQVHPQTSGTFIPGTSTLEQGGHLEDIYARLREIGSQVHQVTRGSDPKHFMTSFMTTIAKAHFSDEQRDIGCCQLFVEGLTGNALTWFSKLEANSIDNFTQLSTAFLKQYRVFIQPGASSSDFWSMTQEADKTLNTYLGRFKEILSKVTISDEAAVAVFRKGLLQGSQLRKDLAIREPKDLDDALNRASRYAFLEDKEAKLAAKHHPAKAKEKNRETHQEPRQHYDPNTAKRGTVFAATESEGRPPAPAKPSDSKSSYCHFHNFGGHSTEECKHLLNILLGKYKSGEVEAVYQPKEGRNKRRGGKQPQGDLEEDDLPPPENHQANREEEARVPEHELPGPPKRLRGQHPERAPNQPRGRISMIMGGLSDGEDYVRALKKRARQVCSVVAAPEKEQLSQDPITFTPEDAHGLQHPHNDALVVELVMEDFEVERVLVDTGSSDMTGIAPEVTCHRLNTDPTFKPVRQKRRRLGPDRAQAVQDEVIRLLKAGLIMEVQYPECYPLPHIDRLVEVTAGNHLLSFMDAFSGYNQILMHKDDYEKTAFITDRGTAYCYRVMPFGLKNAGATYQRLVNKMFAKQLGVTMEVYIDNMVVKSLQASDHIKYLSECIDILDEYRMKLNPTKCTFGVTSGEFLGYIVTERGIEANPKQINAILELPSPQNKREVQLLTGRIATLNRFIARSTDRCLPFYKLLRGNKDFHWDETCELAFQELKEYLTSGAILAKPEEGETLYLYVSVSGSAVSGVLVRNDRGNEKPIFYTSKALNDAETRYPTLEKLALAVITAAQKLRPHFQSHSVVVYTDQPLRTVLHSPNQSGRIAKWAIELSEYDVEYR
ncbi:Retrotransposon gag domain [Arabidopsis thaliana x Arabidopsis arenosa]|uniref:Retrotransposon gag domain n=1 Tax=Arabidopsis thaliana x Arabidopsis arenosa TaxID=1240361 RepID=A0A8T1ZLZ3_9BRAS|nr:Retrotransposon gag domain [Arabidopsis thaliana x Arabidopsis arenosa]